jgi:hypothetical protein
MTRYGTKASPAAQQKAHADGYRLDFRLAAVESAHQTIGTLSPGCAFTALTKGQFSKLDLLRAVLDQTGPAHVLICTWTAAGREIANAKYLLDTERILSLRMLIDRSFLTRQSAYPKALIEAFGEEAVRVTKTHAKLFIVRNSAWSVVVTTSMNLTKNPRLEHFTLMDSPEIARSLVQVFDQLDYEMPPGLDVDNAVTHRVFTHMFADVSCGDVASLQRGKTEAWARLGYTRQQIAARLAAPPSPFDDGARALADQYRQATISAALGGDVQARQMVAGWLSDQRS